MRRNYSRNYSKNNKIKNEKKNEDQQSEVLDCEIIRILFGFIEKERKMNYK